jgi:hypothetical protein
LLRAALRPWSSYQSGIADTLHHAGLIGWDVVLLTFCPGWPHTAVLLISVSWIAGIIGVSHQIAYLCEIAKKEYNTCVIKNQQN